MQIFLHQSQTFHNLIMTNKIFPVSSMQNKFRSGSHHSHCYLNAILKPILNLWAHKAHKISKNAMTSIEMFYAEA